MLALVSCGDLDPSLQRGASTSDVADDPWDDPWGARETDGGEAEPAGHVPRLDACEDVAHWDRLFASSEQASIEVERARLSCLTGVNEDAALLLRQSHSTPAYVDEGMAEHRRFGTAVCDLLSAAAHEEIELRSTTCAGDMELTLGQIIGAHADLAEGPTGLAEQPWLYPECPRDFDVDPQGHATEAFVACIERAVVERLDRVARELLLAGAATSDDVDELARARDVAETACACFEGTDHAEICTADWLILGRHVIDAHVEG